MRFRRSVPENNLTSIEHPLFLLATRPDRRILGYRYKDSEVTVTPSVRGRSVSRILTRTAHHLLSATAHETRGESQWPVREALEWLAGSHFTTDIVAGERKIKIAFGLIEASKIVRAPRDAELRTGAGALRHGLWRVSLEVLLKKLSSGAPLGLFRAMMEEIIRSDSLPNRRLEGEGTEIIAMFRKKAVVEERRGGPALTLRPLRQSPPLLQREISTRLKSNGRVLERNHPPCSWRGLSELGEGAKSLRRHPKFTMVNNCCYGIQAMFALNSFAIGFQKSGTTYLASLLDWHPNMHGFNLRESQLFSKKSPDEGAAYPASFRSRSATAHGMQPGGLRRSLAAKLPRRRVAPITIDGRKVETERLVEDRARVAV